MSRFDEELAALDISDEQKQRLRDASALRQEAQQARDDAAAKDAENAQLRQAVLRDGWKRVGAVGDPASLRLPDGFNITDDEALRDFASKGGFLPANPDVPAADLEAHQRVANASTGATSAPTDKNEQRRQILSAADPNEFWARAAAAGMTAEPYHHQHDFIRLP